MDLRNNSMQFANHPQYPQPFTPAKIPAEIKYVHNSYRLVINSADRDRSIYRNPNEFKIILPRRYRNISSIECGLIALPNFSNSEKYFLIEIEEICDGPYDSLNQYISDAIALVPNRHALGNYNYILESPGDTSFIKNYIKKFVDTPLASLSTLTLRIRKPSGDIVNFGQDLYPYDRPYDFSETETSLNVGLNRLTINTIGNDLGLNNQKDMIEIYDAKIKYQELQSNGLVTVTEPLNELNRSWEATPEGTNQNFFIETTNEITTKINNFTVNFTNWTITGKWRRAKNQNGYYSRVQIDSISIVDKVLTITTLTAHNLNKYDRIFITNNENTETTAWYNNYHIVTEIDNTLHDHDGDPNTDEVPKNNVFKISADNIALDDITYIPLRPDQHDPENNEANLPIDTTLVNVEDPNFSENVLPTAPNFGFVQKYGEPDPSIQNMFIFNINTRDEDNQQVTSQNIPYGNL
tara:strand:+ start:4795 stop:6192 length:1398 start_codon:yes stop_codon:yes gene_type:complete